MIGLGAISRARLSQDAAALRQRLNGPARVVQSVRRHPLSWLGGSLVAGLATTLLLRRKPAKPKPARGLRGVLFSLAVTAIRPLAKTWLTAQLTQRLVSQNRQEPRTRPFSNENTGSGIP